MTDTNELPPTPTEPSAPDAPVETPKKKSPMKTILIVSIALVAIAGGAIVGALFAGGLLTQIGSGLSGGSPATAMLEVNVNGFKPEEGSLAHMKVATHAQLVGSTPTINRALDLDDDPRSNLQLNIRSLDWFQQDPSTAAERLAAALQVEPIEGTSLIAVRVRTSDPETSAILATAVAQAHVLNTMDTTERVFMTELRNLLDQKRDYERDADDLEQQRRRLVAGSVPPAFSGSTAAILKDMVAEKRALKKDLERARVDLAALEVAERDGTLLETSQAKEVLLADPGYSALVAQEAVLEAELGALQDLHEADHPSVTTLRTKLESFVSQREQRETEVTKDLLSPVRSEIDAIIQELQLLEADIQSYGTRLLQVERSRREIEALEAPIATATAQVDELERQIDELRIAGRDAWQVRLLGMAEVPSE